MSAAYLIPGTNGSKRSTTGTIPDTDVYGLPRPQQTAHDWGAAQKNAVLKRNTSVVRTGTYSYEITERGVLSRKFAVPASTAVNVSVYVRWDNNANIGTKPRLEVFDSDGTSLGTDDPAGPDDGTSWVQLVVSVSSVAAPRVIRARVYNRSTHTSAISVYVDDITAE